MPCLLSVNQGPQPETKRVNEDAGFREPSPRSYAASGDQVVDSAQKHAKNEVLWALLEKQA